MVLSDIWLVKGMADVAPLAAVVKRGHKGPIDGGEGAKLQRGRRYGHGRFYPAGKSSSRGLMACSTRGIVVAGRPGHGGKCCCAMLRRQLAWADEARPKRPAQTDQQGSGRECNDRE